MIKSQEVFLDIVQTALDRGFTTDQIADEVGVEHDSVLTRLRRHGPQELHQTLRVMRAKELEDRNIVRYEHQIKCHVGHWSKTPGPCTHGHRSKTKGSRD